MKRLPPTAPTPRSNSPFAALGALRDALPVGETTPVAAEEPAPAARPGPARAVVRYERKGRGGKEATVIAQLDLDDAERVRWLQGLKQSLGCGGVIEGETIVLQGDQRTRIAALLSQRGVRRVTVA